MAQDRKALDAEKEWIPVTKTVRERFTAGDDIGAARAIAEHSGVNLNRLFFALAQHIDRENPDNLTDEQRTERAVAAELSKQREKDRKEQEERDAKRRTDETASAQADREKALDGYVDAFAAMVKADPAKFKWIGRLGASRQRIDDEIQRVYRETRGEKVPSPEEAAVTIEAELRGKIEATPGEQKKAQESQPATPQPTATVTPELLRDPGGAGAPQAIEPKTFEEAQKALEAKRAAFKARRLHQARA